MNKPHAWAVPGSLGNIITDDAKKLAANRKAVEKYTKPLYFEPEGSGAVQWLEKAAVVGVVTIGFYNDSMFAEFDDVNSDSFDAHQGSAGHQTVTAALEELATKVKL